MKALRYPDPPEVGTLLGPDYHQRYHVVTGTDEQGRTLTRFAGMEDMAAAGDALEAQGARSLAELNDRANLALMAHWPTREAW